MAAQTAQAAPSTTVEVPLYVTVNQWEEHFSWPPRAGLRHLIFNAATNGFGPAFKRVGSRVLINTAKFWEIVDSQDAAA